MRANILLKTKWQIIQIEILQREQMVNRVSSSFGKGGHSGALSYIIRTQLKFHTIPTVCSSQLASSHTVCPREDVCRWCI